MSWPPAPASSPARSCASTAAGPRRSGPAARPASAPEDGSLTAAGRAARDARERRTDELSAAPWARLGPGGCDRLLTLLDEPVRLVVEGGGIPFPNPVGLPPPSA
jgi:hypothetical protein